MAQVRVRPAPRHVTALQVMVNLMKCAVGAGSFSVPYAFKARSQPASHVAHTPQTAGMGAGLFGGVLLGVLSCYTIILLARVEKHVVLQDADLKRLTYPQACTCALDSHSPAQLAAKVFPKQWRGVFVHEFIVYANIIATCIGACMAYVIFIAQTLPEVITALVAVRAVLHAAACHARQWEVVLIIMPILIGLALLRTFHVLSFTSILGDVAIVTGARGALWSAH